MTKGNLKKRSHLKHAPNPNAMFISIDVSHQIIDDELHVEQMSLLIVLMPLFVMSLFGGNCSLVSCEKMRLQCLLSRYIVADCLRNFA